MANPFKAHYELKQKKERAVSQRRASNQTSSAGRSIVLRNNPNTNSDIQNKLKQLGYNDAAIKRLADKDNREAFENDLQNYKTVSNQDAKKSNPYGMTGKQYKAKVQAEKQAEIDGVKNAISEKYGITESEFDKAYNGYKNSEASIQKSLDTWGDPSYKMSKTDKKQFKDYYKKFLNENPNAKKLSKANTPNASAAISSNLTPEEREKYAQMADISNKTSAASSFAMGVNSAFPFFNEGYNKLTEKTNDLLGYEKDHSYKTAIENANQNKEAKLLGNVAGTIGMYGLANEVIPILPVVGKATKGIGKTLSKVPVIGKLGADAITGFANDMTADLALDTLPEYVSNIKNGMSEDKAKTEALKNIGVNAAFNLIPTVGSAVKDYKETSNSVVDSILKGEYKANVSSPTKFVVPQATIGDIGVDSDYFKALNDAGKEFDEQAKILNEVAQRKINGPNVTTGNVDISGLGEMPKNTYTPNNLNNYYDDFKYSDTKWGRYPEKKLREILSDPNITVKDKNLALEQYTLNSTSMRTLTEEELRGILADNNIPVAVKDKIIKSANKPMGRAVAEYLTYGDNRRLLGKPITPGEVPVGSKIPKLSGSYDNVVKKTNINPLDSVERYEAPKFENPYEKIKKNDVITPTEVETNAIPNVEPMQNLESVTNVEPIQNVVEPVQKVVKPKNTMQFFDEGDVDVNVPQVKKANKQKYNSSFKETFEKTTNEDLMTELVGKKLFDNETITNNETLNSSMKKLRRDLNGEATRLMADPRNIYDANDMTEAFIIKSGFENKAQKALEMGDIETANKYNEYAMQISNNIVEAGRDYGRVIQSISMFTRNDVDAVQIAAKGILGERTEKFIKENPKVANKIDNAVKKLGETLEKIEASDNPDRLKNSLKKSLSASLEKDIDDNLVEKISEEISQGKNLDSIGTLIKQYEATGSTGLSGETITKLKQIYSEMKSLPIDSKAHIDKETQAYALIANEVSNSSFMEKWDAWRYFAMLSKPSTDARNIFGNISMGMEESLADKLSAALELALPQSMRTKTLGPIDKNMLEAAENDFFNKSYRAAKGNKYKDGSTKGFINQNKRIFKNNALEFVTKKKSGSLDSQDTWSFKNAYRRTQAGFLQARGYDSSIFDVEDTLLNLKAELKDTNELMKAVKERGEDLTQYISKKEDILKKIDELQPKYDDLVKSRKYAIKKAEQATFHEESKLANKLSDLSRTMRNSDNVAEKIFGYLIEGIMPFKNVPINVAKQELRFSPLNLIRALTSDAYGVYKGKVEPTKMIEDFSKGATGTALMALGYIGSQAGIIKANSITDAEKAAGMSEYSININGKNYPIGWLAPAAFPVLIGAKANELREKNSTNEGLDIEDMFNTVTALFDPLVETTMLQGINDVFKTIGYAANNKNDDAAGSELALAGAKASTSYVTQGVPSILGGIARTVDPYYRSSMTNASGTVGIVEKAVRQAMNKVPYLSMQNPKSVDKWGEPNSTGDNVFDRALNNIFLPTTVSEIKMNNLDTTISNLEKQGFDNAMVGNAYKSVQVLNPTTNTKEKVKLTPEEYSIAQETGGKAKRELDEMAVERQDFNALSAELQTQVLDKINTLGNMIGAEKARPDFVSDDETYAMYKEKGAKETVDSIIKDTVAGYEVNKIKEESGVELKKSKYKELYDLGGQKAVDKWVKDTQYAEQINEKYGLNDNQSFSANDIRKYGNSDEVNKVAQSYKNTNTFNETYNKDVSLSVYESYKEKGASDKDINLVLEVKNMAEKSDMDVIDVLDNSNFSESEKSNVLKYTLPKNTLNSKYVNRGIKTFGESALYKVLSSNNTAKKYYDSDKNGSMKESEYREFVNSTIKDPTERAQMYYVLTGKKY